MKQILDKYFHDLDKWPKPSAETFEALLTSNDIANTKKHLASLCQTDKDRAIYTATLLQLQLAPFTIDLIDTLKDFDDYDFDCTSIRDLIKSFTQTSVSIDTKPVSLSKIYEHYNIYHLLTDVSRQINYLTIKKNYVPVKLQLQKVDGHSQIVGLLRNHDVDSVIVVIINCGKKEKSTCTFEVYGARENSYRKLNKFPVKKLEPIDWMPFKKNNKKLIVNIISATAHGFGSIDKSLLTDEISDELKCGILVVVQCVSPKYPMSIDPNVLIYNIIQEKYMWLSGITKNSYVVLSPTEEEKAIELNELDHTIIKSSISANNFKIGVQ